MSVIKSQKNGLSSVMLSALSCDGGLFMTKGNRVPRKAEVSEAYCVACGCCVKVCPLGAISIYRGIKAVVDQDKCLGCGKCAKECPASVIEIREAAV